MENRYKIPIETQRRYFRNVERISQLSQEELAKLFNIAPRSYRDWRRGKFPLTQKAAEIIEREYKLTLPYSKTKAFKIWKKNKINAAKKGGRAVFLKYGCIATLEGRIKGGNRAIEILRQRGLIPPAKPFLPTKGFSLQLAELTGILLGDGHVGKVQWSITLNSIKDKDYVEYVKQLIVKLFHFQPSVRTRHDCKATIISGSGVNSIKYFISIGLIVGNKVKNQVDVPNWIKASSLFKIECLRGLVDTDGGIFNHKYKVNGKEYQYKKLCFTNRSVPLLNFVKKTLEELDFHPKIILKVENKKVWLYNENEVKRYLEIIGTNNNRLLAH